MIILNIVDQKTQGRFMNSVKREKIDLTRHTWKHFLNWKLFVLGKIVLKD